MNALGAKDEFIIEIKTGPKGKYTRDTKTSNQALSMFWLFPGRRGQLGFKITGGRDRPCVPGDPGIFIKGIKAGSKIEKFLRPGDKILKVIGHMVY